MEFGIQFFPVVGPAERSAQQYWNEALRLVGWCDELGYHSVRTIEHYFHPYGGYSPNPLVFLSAAAMRTTTARLITGAVLPAFNNPLKLAGEIGMLDAISNFFKCDEELAKRFAITIPPSFPSFPFVKSNETREEHDIKALANTRPIAAFGQKTAAGGVWFLLACFTNNANSGVD